MRLQKLLPAACCLLVFCAFAHTPVTAPAQSSGSSKSAYSALHTFDSQDKNTGPEFTPDARDAKVDSSIGFSAEWNGKPSYEFLFWCSAEVLADSAEQPSFEVKSALSRKLIDDAYDRLKGDRPDTPLSAAELEKKMTRLAFWLGAFGYAQLGHAPTGAHCLGEHEEYQARFHPRGVAAPVAKAAKPAPSATNTAGKSIPFITGAKDPLAENGPNPNDLIITRSPGPGFEQWVGHAWYQPLIWCQSVLVAKWQEGGKTDATIREKIGPLITVSKERLAKDRSVSADDSVKGVRMVMDFYARQMLAQNFSSTPEGQAALTSCPNLADAYTAQVKP